MAGARPLARLAFGGLLLLVLVPFASAGPVGVGLTEDAQGDLVAVSVTGNATSDFAAVSLAGHAHSTCREFGTIPCATATLVGSTSGSTNTIDVGHFRVCHNDGAGRPRCAIDGDSDAEGPVALSWGGRATGAIAAASVAGDAEAGYLALAKGGDATASWVAASGEGDARAVVAVAPCGHAEGVVAVGRDAGACVLA